MMILNILFIFFELLRRAKGDFADFDTKEPTIPQFDKKLKEKPKEEDQEGEESDTEL